MPQVPGWNISTWAAAPVVKMNILRNLMWVKHAINSAMFNGNGKHTTYENGDDWGMACCCFSHLKPEYNDKHDIVWWVRWDHWTIALFQMMTMISPTGTWWGSLLALKNPFCLLHPATVSGPNVQGHSYQVHIIFSCQPIPKKWYSDLGFGIVQKDRGKKD